MEIKEGKWGQRARGEGNDGWGAKCPCPTLQEWQNNIKDRAHTVGGARVISFKPWQQSGGAVEKNKVIKKTAWNWAKCSRYSKDIICAYMI